jgi:Domain of unknown function (DUF1707)
VRLSDTDREALLDKLNRHAAAGSLTLEELERRVEVVMVAATREEAMTVMDDLPPLAGEPGPAAARWRRGHAHADRPGADWRPTNERFRDPRTDRVMRVWEDAAGARHYVPDEPTTP